MADPLPKNNSAEQRLAALEDSVLRINEFNQKVTAALTHVLERLQEFEPVGHRVMRLENRVEDYRTAETLARASRIFPKSRSVVFVSKGYFGDNAKYAFLAFCDYARGKDIAVHFLAGDAKQREMLCAAGLPCLSCEPKDWSPGDIRTLFGAKVAVLSDNFHPHVMNPQVWGMLGGAKTVQLWHGIPMKEIGMGYIQRGDGVVLDELLASSGTFDVFTAPAKAAREDWARRFAFREFAATGYPRNDVFFREPTPHDLLNTDRETLKLFEDARRAGKPAILYAPTYRDDEAESWFGKTGIEKLADHARAKGYAFAVNLHPYEQVLAESYRARFPGIRFVAGGTDIYPLAKQADMLVTDYSSLAFDYLLLDRPLIFFRPDHEGYIKRSRGFIEGRDCLTPGPVVADINALIRVVDDAAGFIRTPAADPHKKARADLRKQLFDHVDGDAGKRVGEVVMGLVETP